METETFTPREHSAPERWPAPGDNLGEGRTVLDFRPIYSGGPGSYAYGTGLFVREGKRVHPFAIWSSVVWNDDREEWVMESGSYFHSLTEAVRSFSDRNDR